MNHEFEIFEKFGLGDKMNSVGGEMLNLVALREHELQNILKGGSKKEKEVLEH